MSDKNSWKLKSRRAIYSSKFANIFSDDVVLPNGYEITDYSVISFPDAVVIVATDESGRLIAIDEYKYAIDKIILNLPSGIVEAGVDVIEQAKRELLEETGYTADNFYIVKEIYEYPSKLTHSLFVVRAKNAKKISDTAREITEQIGEIRLISPNDNHQSEFNTSYNLAAIALAAPEFLK